MILQALADYYRRKYAAEPGVLPEYGFQQIAIDFVIVVNPDGSLDALTDQREPSGKRLVGRPTRLPQAVNRSSGVAANLLWDHAGYVLGHDSKGKPERAQKQLTAFIDRIESTFPAPRDTAVEAVLRFLHNDPLQAVEADPNWPALRDEGGNLTFELAGDGMLVCERPSVQVALGAAVAQEEGAAGLCLVTGQREAVARLHAPIKGVAGGHTTGCSVVSFNLDAFTSYGKSQGENAPVGAHAAFAYTTALNHLLRYGSPQRLTLADATVVFWSEGDGEQECLFTEALGDHPDRHAAAVKAILESYKSGAPPRPDDEDRFFILGLAPNAARLSVRLWQQGTTRQIGERIYRHFDLLQLDHGGDHHESPSMRALLRAIAVRHEDANIPPNLAGDTLRAILAGLYYPRTLLNAAILRNRAEQEVTTHRAALLKAWLNRQQQWERDNGQETPLTQEKEIDVSLDESNHNIGYLLGRLFLLLEQAQASAIGSRRTLRERYFAVASTNPAAVFPRLLRMYQHYSAKLETNHPGLAVVLDREIGKVMEQVAGFPVTLALEDQGRFAIGYYHQRTRFFEKKEKPAAAEETTHA